MPTKKTQTVDPPTTLWWPAVLLVGCGMLLMLGARAGGGSPVRLFDFLPFLLWVTVSGLFALALHVARFDGDRALPGAIILLTGIGVWLRFRTGGSPENPLSVQVWVYPMGMLMMTGTWMSLRKGRISWLQPFGILALIVSLLVPMGLLALGTRFRGAVYGPGGMTPTELLKLSVPLALAALFAAREREWKGRSVWRCPWGAAFKLGLFWGLLTALLMVQRDLGMILMLSGMLVGVLVGFTRSWSWGLAAGLGLGGAVAAISQWIPHAARRLDVWMNPFEDPTGSGWQVLQGLSGLYAGGVVGTGLGQGRPDRLPIAGSDFIYAVVGEELGLVGCALLLLLYGRIVAQGWRVAERQPDAFRFVLVLSFVLLFGLQTLINVAGVVTLMPVTGVPLPLLSQGGTSALVTQIQLGCLLACSEAVIKTKRRRKK